MSVFFQSSPLMKGGASGSESAAAFNSASDNPLTRPQSVRESTGRSSREYLTIFSSFISIGSPCGNDSKASVANGVYNVKFGYFNLANRYVPDFSVIFPVINNREYGSIKHARSGQKAYPVFLDIQFILAFVPFEFHSLFAVKDMGLGLRRQGSAVTRRRVSMVKA